MNPRRQFILSGTALALALSLPLSASAAQPAQLGFVYVSPIGDAGWTFQHDQGRKEMEKALLQPQIRPRDFLTAEVDERAAVEMR